MRTSKRSKSFYKAVFTTRGPAQTRKLGASLGKALGGREIIHLRGGLGSGKTCFVKGLVAGLGVTNAQDASSPTFTLINEYPGAIPLFHVDLYRLDSHDEIRRLGLEDHFTGGVVAVEWAEKLPPEYRRRDVSVRLTAISNRIRLIEIEAEGEAAESLKNRLLHPAAKGSPGPESGEQPPRGDRDTP
jgi:tRNA threonylcarbamoyladenosine biosynthesis protein TsaE